MEVQSDKQDTRGKETQGSDEEDEYLPTPPVAPDQDNRNNTKEEKKRDGDGMKSTTSEQSEHTPKTVRSGVDQKDVGESEEEQREESGKMRRGIVQKKARRKGIRRKRKADQNIHPADAAVTSR